MVSSNDNLPNDDKESQDSAYNPGEQAHLEGAGTPPTKSSSESDGDGSPDAANDIDDAEQKGSWKSSYGGNKSKNGQGISKGNFRAILKKRGPLAAIITLLVGGGVGAGIFFGPSLLLVQIQESFLNAFDSQNTSLTIRTNKIITNKLVEQNTSGSCTYVKVACRFSRPSNKLLGNLEKNGIQAFDKNGDVISKTGVFQTDRPIKYTFNGKDIPAKNFASELRGNDAFRAAFHRAYNPRFVGFTDSVFKIIQSRFGFSLSGKNADTGKSTTEVLNDASKGVNAAVADGTEAGAEDVAKNLISKRASEVLTKIAKGGKGDTVGLTAALACTAADIPKLLISTVAIAQVIQEVNYSAPLLTDAGKMKAGEITQEQSSGDGKLLTESVNGKTAMDSLGVRNAMYGDTRSSNTSWKRFVPGASAFQSVGGLSQVLSSDIKNAGCDVATNPVTGQVINVGLAVAGPETLGASLAVAGINLVVGYAVSEIVTRVAVPLVGEALKTIDTKSLVQLFAGDLTQNLKGEDVGNAFASGASHMMAQTANAGGNMPLSIEQAVAYHQSSLDVQIAYAQEDRATHSPLDVSNPNTFVGSIVGKIVPYFANVSSLSGAFSSVAALPSASLAAVLNTSTASALSADNYSQCEDPAVTSGKIAAGIFCNVQYGIPPQYLDKDPQEIVDSLVASGEVDADTGDPIDKAGPSLSDWLTRCTDGTTDNLKGCQIVDDSYATADQKATWSIYAIDHRVQKSMDEDDSSSVSTDKKTLASNIVAKQKVSYLGDVQPTLESIASGAVDPNAEPCGINVNILKIIDLITNSHSIKISDINRHCTNSTADGASSTASRHYAGNGSAIDIAAIDGVALTGRDAKSVEIINLIMPVLSAAATTAESKTPGQTSSIGQLQCGPAVTMVGAVKSFNDFCTHLHIDIPPDSDPNLKHS